MARCKSCGRRALSDCRPDLEGGPPDPTSPTEEKFCTCQSEANMAKRTMEEIRRRAEDGKKLSKKEQARLDLDGSPADHQPGDSTTALTEKTGSSALAIRKITKYGFPIYVGIISDDNLDGLDQLIHETLKPHIKPKKGLWKSNSLQDKRNLTGILHDAILEHFEKTEGVAITLMIDKAYVSSLFGDFMNHAMCRSEYYSLLHMSTAI